MSARKKFLHRNFELFRGNFLRKPYFCDGIFLNKKYKSCNSLVRSVQKKKFRCQIRALPKYTTHSQKFVFIISVPMSRSNDSTTGSTAIRFREIIEIFFSGKLKFYEVFSYVKNLAFHLNRFHTSLFHLSSHLHYIAGKLEIFKWCRWFKTIFRKIRRKKIFLCK